MGQMNCQGMDAWLGPFGESFLVRMHLDEINQ